MVVDILDGLGQILLGGFWHFAWRDADWHGWRGMLNGMRVCHWYICSAGSGLSDSDMMGESK